MKNDAEFELSKATPLLEEAERVVKEIKKDDLTVLASIKKPTPAVVLGMEISCYMMGLKAKKTNVGKVDGDTNGYFDLARSTLLSNTQSFLN